MRKIDKKYTAIYQIFFPIYAEEIFGYRGLATLFGALSSLLTAVYITLYTAPMRQ
jgi:hypothetical protein